MQFLKNIFLKDGPPDLDEFVQKWFNFLRGKKKKPNPAADAFRDGGNGGNSNKEPPKPESDNSGNNGGNNKKTAREDKLLTRMGVSIFLMLIVLGYLLAGFFTVDASERGVMFRLGNPTGVRGPGLQWHIPLIEDYRIVNVSEVRRVEIGYRNETKNKNLKESLMLTQDLNIIDMQFVVQYALNDPELFLFENRFNNQNSTSVVQQVAETAIREIVGRSNIDFVLYEGREAIADEARSLMQEILNLYKTGIEVQEVAVQNVQPPDQVQDAFEDAIKARQDRERKINEGQAYANDILPRAQGQASRIVKEAQAYRESTIIRAQGDSSRFLQLAAEYAGAPAVTHRRLYLETMEEVMGRANKIMIDDTAGDGNLLYLPLDRLFGAAAALPAFANPGGSGGAGGAAAGSSAQRSLEAVKQQIRERANQASQALTN